MYVATKELVRSVRGIVPKEKKTDLPSLTLASEGKVERLLIGKAARNAHSHLFLALQGKLLLAIGNFLQSLNTQ